MGMLDDLLAAAADGQAPGSKVPGAQDPAIGRSGKPRGGGAGSSALVALLPIVLALLANRRSSQGGASPGRGGGLGDLLGQVLGGGGDAGTAGGLGGLLRQPERGGFGDQARSWVGPVPITRSTRTRCGRCSVPTASRPSPAMRV